MSLVARPAILADAPFLLTWRNDPATITASRVQAPVTAHDHVAWLERALADPARRLMIATRATIPSDLVIGVRAAPLGTYRLDGVGGERVEVSLTVAPEHRGRGLAREVVELACRHAVREGADVVTAEIRRENIPSFVAFFRNGFMITGCTGDGPIIRRGRFVSEVSLLQLEVDAEEIIRRACPLCMSRTPHHTNATGSIGGDEGRHPRYDLHVGQGGGLAECEAGDLWLAWEGARSRRIEGGRAGMVTATTGKPAPKPGSSPGPSTIP